MVEDSLVLDILFLGYYESFCNCNGERWKKLCLLFKVVHCYSSLLVLTVFLKIFQIKSWLKIVLHQGILCGSYNFRKLEISTEALLSSYQAKVQLLLILIETLDLENLLQMVHDEKPFRCCLNCLYF